MKGEKVHNLAACPWTNWCKQPGSHLHILHQYASHASHGALASLAAIATEFWLLQRRKRHKVKRLSLRSNVLQQHLQQVAARVVQCQQGVLHSWCVLAHVCSAQELYAVCSCCWVLAGQAHGQRQPAEPSSSGQGAAASAGRCQLCSGLVQAVRQTDHRPE